MRHFKIHGIKFKILPPPRNLEETRCSYCEANYDGKERRRFGFDSCGHEKCMACALKSPTCDKCENNKSTIGEGESQDEDLAIMEIDQDFGAIANSMMVKCLLSVDLIGDDEFPEVKKVDVQECVDDQSESTDQPGFCMKEEEGQEYIPLVDLCDEDEPELVDLTETEPEEMNVEVAVVEGAGSFGGFEVELERNDNCIDKENERMHSDEGEHEILSSSQGPPSLSGTDDGYKSVSPPPPLGHSNSQKHGRKRKLAKTVSDFDCKYCKETFSDRKYLSEHLTTEHSEVNLYSCETCSSTFESLQNLETHMLTHTNARPLVCPHCDTRFNAQLTFEEHLEKVHAYQVPIKITSGVLRLQRGRANETGRVNVIAKPVNLFLKRRIYSKRKIRKPVVPTATPYFPCTLCKEKFPKRNQLGKHKLEKHSEELPCSCHICGWSFTNKFRLDLHLVTHTIERPHKCNQCQGSFKRKDSLDRHVRIVHLKAPTKSEESASKILRRKAAICSYCLLQVDNRELLAKHLKENHSEKRPYACELCEWPFERRKHLNAHMKTHSKKKQFRCSICDSKFNWKYSLERHMDNVHKISIRLQSDENQEEVEYCEECQSAFDKKNHLKVAYSECGHLSCLECVVRLELGCGQCATEKVEGSVIKRRKLDVGACLENSSNQIGRKSKWYECRYCDQRFSSKPDVGVHMAEMHKKERPFSCEVCRWPFAKQRNLDQHEKGHLNAKPFACHHCDMSFTRKSSLHRHTGNAHGKKRAK